MTGFISPHSETHAIKDISNVLLVSTRIFYKRYCRTGFDSDGLIAAKIATKNDRYHGMSL